MKVSNFKTSKPFNIDYTDSLITIRQVVCGWVVHLRTLEHFLGEERFQILISQGVELWAWLALARTPPSSCAASVDTSSVWPVDVMSCVHVGTRQSTGAQQHMQQKPFLRYNQSLMYTYMCNTIVYERSRKKRKKERRHNYITFEYITKFNILHNSLIGLVLLVKCVLI